MGNHKAQRGALLIELAIGVAILTLLAVGAVSWMAQQSEKNKVEGLAVVMQSVQQGVQDFLDTHAFELMSGEGLHVEGINQWQRPTLSELQQLGFLAPSFQPNPGIEVVMYKEGDCPGEQCYMHALVYAKRPFVNKKQQMDMHAVAHWQGAVQGAGLVVQTGKPMAFSGVQLTVDLQHLPAGLVFPVGSVALLASSKAITEDVLVRRYLLLPHTEAEGGSCDSIGAVSRNEQGQGLLVCEQNTWIRASAQEPEGDSEPSAGSPPDVSFEAYKAMISTYWKVSIPEHTPGGFYARAKNQAQSYDCWVPNPYILHTDGRGVCACPRQSVLHYNLVSAVRDNYFRDGIGRPALEFYFCV